jgi:hypothetical protein
MPILIAFTGMHMMEQRAIMNMACPRRSVHGEC